MGKDIFRKVSLEKLTSPEQLNRLLVIIRLKGWMILISLMILIIVVVLWAIFGKIPVTVSGRGLLFHEGAIQSIRSSVQGVVSKIEVHTGDDVKKGALLARLSNPILDIEFSSQKKIVDSLVSEIETETKFKNARLEFQQMFLTMKRAKLEGMKREYERAKEEKAVYLSQIEKAVSDQQLMIKAQEEKISLLQNQEGPMSALKLSYLGNQAKLEILEKQVKHLNVSAPVSGKIIEVNIAEEIEVEPGEVLFWIQPPLREYEKMDMHAFIPIEEASRIKKGMKAQIRVQRVDEAEYGQLQGVVVDVFPYAVSQDEEQLRSIPSRALREYLTEGDVSVLVKIQPLVDQSTPSGYRWTKGAGPDFKLQPGALGRVRIFVEEKSPIAYLLPVSKG